MEVMRISVTRYAMVVLIAFGLTGCQGGNSWSMPGLASWRSNPFSSSESEETPSGIPKPSEVVSSLGTPTTTATTASTTTAPGTGYGGMSYPGTGYTGIGSPTRTNPSTAAGYNAPYNYPQQPYPSTQPTPPPSYGAGGGSVPYVATQPGNYGLGSSASTAPSSPYAYPGTPNYSGSAASPYGPLGGSQSARPSSYTSAGTAGPYANPVRPSTGSTSGSDRYSSGSDRYGAASGRYAAGTDRYQTATITPGAGASGSQYTGGPTAGSGYPAKAGSLYSPGPGSNYSGAGIGTPPRYGATTPSGGASLGSRYNRSPSGPSAAPTSVAPYASTATTQPQSGYPAILGSAAQSYTPADNGYTPAANGYQPPGVAPYQSPAGTYRSPTPGASYQTPSTQGSGTQAPYQPGSVQSYTPTNTGPAAAPATSATFPRATMGSAVQPADYRQPLGGTYRR